MWWFPVAANPETTKGDHRSQYYSDLNIIAQKKRPPQCGGLVSSDCRDRTNDVSILFRVPLLVQQQFPFRM
jgi:hypothetical protein